MTVNIQSQPVSRHLRPVIHVVKNDELTGQELADMNRWRAYLRPGALEDFGNLLKFAWNSDRRSLSGGV
jgi:hypothetical protein